MVLIEFSQFRSIHEIFLTVHGYNAPGEFPVFSLLPGIGDRSLYMVDRTFTSRGVDLRAHLFIDHCCVSFFECLIFAAGLDSQIILTAKFSRSVIRLEPGNAARPVFRL